MDNQEPKKGKQINKQNVIFIILLMGAMAFIAYMFNEKSINDAKFQSLQNEKNQLTSDIDNMNKMLKDFPGVDAMAGDLKKNLYNMLGKYDKLIQMDASKADSLGMQKERIIGLLNQINSLEKQNKLTVSELVDLKKENETLRVIMKDYISQIDKLNTLNMELRTDLDETNAKLSTTETERDLYKKDADDKTAQVKKGSILQAYGFTTTGMRLKLNKTTKETSKAKQAVQIKSSFTIGQNPITPSGNKVVYLQVVDPSGKTLQFRTNQVFKTESGTLPYSEKRTINYQNKSIGVAIFYDLRGKKLNKGVYKAKVYCDGNLIGTDTFTLK